MRNQDQDVRKAREKKEDDERNRVVSEAQARAQESGSNPYVHPASLALTESFLGNARLFFRAETAGRLARDKKILDAIRIVQSPLPDDPALAIRERRRRRKIGGALDALAKRLREINLTSGRKRQLSLMRNACAEFRQGFHNAAPQLARGRPPSLEVSKDLRAAAKQGFTEGLKAMGFVRRGEENPAWRTAEVDVKRACRSFGFLKQISAYVKREFGDDYPFSARKEMIRGLLSRGNALEVFAYLFFSEDSPLPSDAPQYVLGKVKRIRRSIGEKRRGPAAAADAFVANVFGVSIRKVRAARPQRGTTS